MPNLFDIAVIAIRTTLSNCAIAWDLQHRKPGQYTLLARAKDAVGMLQPDEHDRNYGTYVINHSLPIEVFVDGSGGPRT